MFDLRTIDNYMSDEHIETITDFSIGFAIGITIGLIAIAIAVLGFGT